MMHTHNDTRTRDNTLALYGVHLSRIRLFLIHLFH